VKRTSIRLKINRLVLQPQSKEAPYPTKNKKANRCGASIPDLKWKKAGGRKWNRKKQPETIVSSAL